MNSAKNYNIRLFQNQIEDDFFAAVMSNDVKALENILKLGISINITDKHGRNALHISVMHGYLESVKYLIEHGINIDAVSTSTGATAAHYAVHILYKRNKEAAKQVIQLLAEADAHFGIFDHTFRMPRHYASAEGIQYLGLDQIEKMRIYSTPLTAIH